MKIIKSLQRLVNILLIVAVDLLIVKVIWVNALIFTKVKEDIEKFSMVINLGILSLILWVGLLYLYEEIFEE